MTGALLGQLFRSLFYQLVKTAKKLINMEISKSSLYFKLEAMLDAKYISRGFKFSMATGNWSNSQVAGVASKQGVSQVLNRLSFMSTLSHLRRLNTPLARDGKMQRPRQVPLLF